MRTTTTRDPRAECILLSFVVDDLNRQNDWSDWSVSANGMYLLRPRDGIMSCMLAKGFVLAASRAT